MREPVVVVGAGPVGLVTALALARAGVPVAVLEAGDGPSTESRASTFHPTTLALLEPLGLTEPLLANGLRAPRFQYRDRSDGIVAEFDLGALASELTYPFRIQCEQGKLCAFAMEHLEGLDDVDVRFGHRVTGVADGVVATSAGEMRARFVVAADGASSAAREALGIGFDGLTWPERFLVISTRFELHDIMPDLAYVNYVADPEEWFVLLRTPDHWRVLFPVDEQEPEEIARSDARITERLKGIAPELAAHPIMHATFYRIHQRVAASFRAGSVLLAGDAAHINNPLGGMGMNSGLHDAISASRRLADVWHGRAGEDALDAYAERRRRIALDIVDAHTRQNYERIRAQDPAVRMAHLEEMRATAADPARAAAYMRKAILCDSMEAL